jgi:hypothetical protein
MFVDQKTLISQHNAMVSGTGALISTSAIVSIAIFSALISAAVLALCRTCLSAAVSDATLDGVNS